MNTKISKLLLGVCPILSLFAESAPAAPIQRKPHNFTRTLRGEAFYTVQIPLKPSDRLHVSLVGRVEGEENLPLATTVIPAHNGITPFALKLPSAGVPAGPYRVEAWIVGDNKVLFQAYPSQTVIGSLDTKIRIRLGHIVTSPTTDLPFHGDCRLTGKVNKLDRRALASDAKLVVEVRDVTLQNVPSVLMASTEIELKGHQLPFNYKLPFEWADSVSGKRYAVSARILEGGKLTYISSRNHVFDATKSAQKVDVRMISAHSSN